MIISYQNIIGNYNLENIIYNKCDMTKSYHILSILVSRFINFGIKQNSIKVVYFNGYNDFYVKFTLIYCYKRPLFFAL